MPTSRRARPVCLITHSYYEEDPRVRREAETLVRAGRPVDVLALRRPGDPTHEMLEGVSVTRLPVQRHQGAGIGVYLAEYLEFLVRAAVALVRAHVRRRYALVQVATLPDFLVVAGLPLRLAAGVPLVIDLHEAMPEFFLSRFGSGGGPLVRLARAALLLQERWSIAVATHAITVNDALGDRLVGLGVPPEKLTIILNAPDLRRFDRTAHQERPFMADGTLRLVYTGALTPTYEVDVALDALDRIRTLRPELPVTLDVYGRGDAEEGLRAQAIRLGLGGRVTFHGRVPLEAVAGAVAAADVGLTTTRRSEMTDVSLSTKLFEYAAMGKPVVASGLPTVRRYFAPETVACYEPGDADDLARVLLALVDDPAARAARLAATEARVAELGWEAQGRAYVALVDRLADRLSSARA